jgi:hypothetical protein
MEYGVGDEDGVKDADVLCRDSVEDGVLADVKHAEAKDFYKVSGQNLGNSLRPESGELAAVEHA